jgi:hypothetical protein
MSLDAILKLRRIIEGKEKPPDLKEIYLKLKQKFKEYVYLDYKIIYYDISACFSISTFYYDICYAFPRLFIFGLMDTAKTKLTKCILCAGHKGYLFLNPSDPSIFRTIDAFKPTLGIDNIEKISKELESTLRGSYKKGSKIPRIEKIRKERFVLSLFDPYTPIVYNSTQMIKDIDLSRSILLVLEKVEENRYKGIIKDYDPETREFQEIRDLLYICRFLYAPKFYEIYKNLDIPIYGREREIWKPILTIAKMIDEELFNNLLNYALEYIEKQKEEYYKEEKEILEAIERIFKEQNAEEISFTSSELVKTLKIILVDEKEELSASRFEKYYTPHKIGRLLTRMGLRKKRMGKERKRLYFLTLKELEEFKKKFGMADNTDINLGDKSIYLKDDKKESFSKNEEKSQDLGEFQKEAIKENIGLSQKQTSVMSETSAEYGICELCGSEKEVFLIKVEQLNNKKIAICQNCLKEMKEDQYQIITKNTK